MSGEYVLRPTGELDLLTVPPLLASWLDAIDKHRPSVLVVDLSEVTFLDSTALNAVVRMHDRQREHQGHVIVTNASPRNAAIFRITGLDRVLQLNDPRARTNT